MQKKSTFAWLLCWKSPIDKDFIQFICQFHQSCGMRVPESVFIQLHLNKACWEIWLSDDEPHPDYNGQWQRVLCMGAVLQSSPPNSQRNEKRKMYAIKQIKICAQYRDMLPRPRLDLSGTPGPGSWQTGLVLCRMSRYSAQILLCITNPSLYYWTLELVGPLWHCDNTQSCMVTSSRQVVLGRFRGTLTSSRHWQVYYHASSRDIAIVI